MSIVTHVAIVQITYVDDSRRQFFQSELERENNEDKQRVYIFKETVT